MSINSGDDVILFRDASGNLYAAPYVVPEDGDDVVICRDASGDAVACQIATPSDGDDVVICRDASGDAVAAKTLMIWPADYYYITIVKTGGTPAYPIISNSGGHIDDGTYGGHTNGWGENYDGLMYAVLKALDDTGSEVTLVNNDGQTAYDNTTYNYGQSPPCGIISFDISGAAPDGIQSPTSLKIWCSSGGPMTSTITMYREVVYPDWDDADEVDDWLANPVVARKTGVSLSAGLNTITF